MKPWIRRILILGAVLAALKCIVVSLQMDEEYAITMSYRLVQGDRLLAQLWDPHQTSAFLIQGLLWIYETICHTTTGSVIFVRIAGVLMHLAVAWLVSREARRHIGREESFLLGLIYFNLLPKGYVMPEFSNMLAWTLTLLILVLLRHTRMQQAGASDRALIGNGILAGLLLSLLVLSYPTGALLYPFLVVYFLKFDRRKMLTILSVTLTCLICGSAYLGYLETYLTPAELIANVQSLIASAGAHQKSAGGIVSSLGYDAIYLALYLAMYLGTAALIYAILRKMEHRSTAQIADAAQASGTAAQASGTAAEASGTAAEKRAEFLYIVIITSFVLQLVHWILMLWKNEWSYPYTVYYLILAGGIAAILHTRDTKRKAAGVLIIGSNIVIFIAVMMLTNLTTFTTVKYLLSGVVGAMLLWLIDTKERYPQLYHRYAMVTLIAWCGVATFVKGWAYPDNDGLMKNVTVIGNIIEQGPAKGILVEYMQGYITESTWEEFHTYVAPGDSLLVMDTNTLCVMYVEDVNVSNSTTICSPTFDENLLDYWERNPEKYPDVIAVQCWYGECKYDADTWMMQWIEDQFGASQVIDGKYFRYYIR